MCGAIGQVCPHAMMNYLGCGGNHTANDNRCRAKLNAIAVARGTRAKGSQLRPVHRKEQEVPMTTSGKKLCIRTQGQRPGASDAQDAQDANWQGILRPDDACQRTGRSERHMPRHLPYGREVTGHLTSGREVSGHLPSGRSAFLTDGDCQGKFLPDAEWQGKCRRDDACHGICLLDAECQGICHPDAACYLQTEIVKANFFRTQRVKANVVRTKRATASAFWSRSVRAFSIRTQRVPYRQRVSRQM